MIKFFRNIRKALLEQNRMTRYLIYALGEIFLVVIGILIALFINNLNQEWQLKKDQLSSLKLLSAELNNNYDEFNYAWQFHQKRDSAIKILLFQDLTKLNVEAIDDLYALAFYSFQLNPSFSAYEAVVSTGQIRNFNSDTLKIMLADFRERVFDYKDGEDDAWEYSQNELFDFEANNSSQLTEVKFNLRERTEKEKVEDKKNYLNLINTPVYRNHLSLTSLHLKVILRDAIELNKVFKDLQKEMNLSIQRLQD